MGPYTRALFHSTRLASHMNVASAAPEPLFSPLNPARKPHFGGFRTPRLRAASLALTVALVLLLGLVAGAAQAQFPVVLDPALTELMCDLGLTPLNNSEASAQTLMARFQQPDVTAHFTAQGIRTDMGVFTHITDDRGRVLLGRRQGSHGVGTWSPSGGHIDAGETSPFGTAAREALEEADVTLGPMVFLGATLDYFPEKRKVYLTLHIGSAIVAGTPRVMEPEKLDGPWQWFRPQPPEECRTGLDRRDHDRLSAYLKRQLQPLVARHPHVVLHDPLNALCPPGTGRCPRLRDGRLLYSDGDHLSGYGASLVLDDLMAALRRRTPPPNEAGSAPARSSAAAKSGP
jgi:8-oxo-dGTP diphosphatase